MGKNGEHDAPLGPRVGVTMDEVYEALTLHHEELVQEANQHTFTREEMAAFLKRAYDRMRQAFDHGLVPLIIGVAALFG